MTRRDRGVLSFHWVPSAAIGVGVIMVVAVAAGSLWWFRMGGTLQAYGGAVTGVGVAGQPVYVSFLVEGDGNGVRLDDVSSVTPPGVQVDWSVAHSASGAVLPAWLGAAPPAWGLEPLHGHHLDRDSTGTTFVVAAVTAASPGVYRIADVSLTYSAGPRTRHATVPMRACVLFTPEGLDGAALAASGDPLWQQYQQCLAAAAVGGAAASTSPPATSSA